LQLIRETPSKLNCRFQFSRLASRPGLCSPNVTTRAVGDGAHGDTRLEM